MVILIIIFMVMLIGSLLILELEKRRHIKYNKELDKLNKDIETRNKLKISGGYQPIRTDDINTPPGDE